MNDEATKPLTLREAQEAYAALVKLLFAAVEAARSKDDAAARDSALERLARARAVLEEAPTS